MFLIFVYMKNFALLILVSLFFFACKEEEIGTQQFVQNHIIGAWPHKVSVNIVKKNGVETLNDTIFHGIDSTSLIVDTVKFAINGQCIKLGDTMKYTIDEEGKNISYAKDSLGTWLIKYLRLKSIILTQEKTEKKGSDTFIYYKEERLIKP